MNLIFNHAVMTWSKEQETAKAFLLYIMEKQNYLKWTTAAVGYDAGPFDTFKDDPVFSSDPKIKAFADVIAPGKWPGWPAQPSKKTSQAQTQYIVADMFAKAISSGDVDGAIKDAESRYKSIFERPG
jgi:multiple sugar transport system substrate-binding protein